MDPPRDSPAWGRSPGVAAVPAEGKFDHLYADKVQEHVARRVEAAFAANQVSDSVEFFVHARFGEVEPLHEWVKPHRYSYIETRVIKRPLAWPLY